MLSSEPKMNSVRRRQAPESAHNCKMAIFCVKVHFMKNVCNYTSLCESRQRQSCKAFIGLSIQVKWLVGDVPFHVKNLAETDPPLQKCQFLISIVPSEKSWINMNTKSTTSFPMNLRWTVYVAASLFKGTQNAKWLLWQNLNNNLR